ncbi:MAG TPA: hypothetical protein VEJ87_07830, partial [Acidimicrobiales bacterium]|nr:hypothetical protein [Acidimicrobiales bacterium]
MERALPTALEGLVERCAAPNLVEATLRRLMESSPDDLERLVDGPQPTELARALVAVNAASNSLGRLVVADVRALDVLSQLDNPVVVDSSDPVSLARSKRLELLRIAARDLLGFDTLEEVGSNLASMASAVLGAALSITTGTNGVSATGTNGQSDCPPENSVDGGKASIPNEALSSGLSIIGMGKLGGEELNYASDVDILFVNDDGEREGEARRVLEVARDCFRVDADLRPEGRAGPLTRSLEGYISYWRRWARTWEFQALLKARFVAGDRTLGGRFEESAANEIWERTYSSEELGEVRSMKARTESMIERRGLAGRELKRGPGGIRDVEFAVQILQLVHGRLDPAIRGRSTLETLHELASAGYVDADDASVLGRAYRFLRTVEHRIQLVEEEQAHAVPTGDEARRRLAIVLGFEDDPSATATERFDEAIRVCLRDVRVIHERLFFRPLLEAFAELDAVGENGRARAATARGPDGGMSQEAISTRLAAFGFKGPKRTRAAVAELAGGLTRSSRLMSQ